MKKHYVLLLLFVLTVSGLAAPSAQSETSNSLYQELTVNQNGFRVSDISQTIYNAVSKSSYQDLVREFSEIGPKPEGSANNDETKIWIMDKLDEFSGGRITSSIEGERESVVGKLSGTLGDDGPCVVIGGHFDTVELAAGANDDGSGVATTLELARVFSSYDWPLDIYFGFWNAEETGLHGSSEIARQFKNQGKDILIYVNIDMILLSDASRPSDEKIFVIYNDMSGVGFHASRYWAELMRAMGNNYDTPIILPLSSSQSSWWAYSDHYSFVAHGYDNVVFASQTEHNDPYYHTSGDRWDASGYDYDIATQAVACMGAAIAHAISIPIEGIVVEEHTVNIPAATTKELLIEMSMPTWIGIRGIWTGAEGTKITVESPTGVELGSSSMAASADLLNVTTTELGLHSIFLQNRQAVPISFTVSFEYDTDIRGNGVPDSEEWWNTEYLIDTDEDGITDVDEITFGSDPNSPDGDEDGVLDYDEIYVYGTNPASNDTDFDDMPDLYEILTGLDPTEKDGIYDHDDDDLITIFEYGNGTSPFDPDSDQDGITDGWELEYGLNPLAHDSTEDPDGDGMINLQEFLSRRDPNVADYVQSTTELGIEEWLAIVASIGIFLVLLRFLWKMRGSS